MGGLKLQVADVRYPFSSEYFSGYYPGLPQKFPLSDLPKTNQPSKASLIRISLHPLSEILHKINISITLVSHIHCQDVLAPKGVNGTC